MYLESECKMNSDNTFKKQIIEDIREYQENYPNDKKLEKDDWAFNYWIMDKFFQYDEEIIEDKIIDYHDMGIDCYADFGETKELYLIQNKFYDENSSVSLSYVNDHFLIRPEGALKSGTYKHCEELQTFYKKYINDSDFVVHLQLYITNNRRDNSIIDRLKEYNNQNDGKVIAEVFYLDDIQEKYYGESYKEIKNFKYELSTVNGHTVLNVNTKDYHIDALLDAKYILTPVMDIFDMYRQAQTENYPIFDKNIREYLGNKGINKAICETLKDKEERKNFFYYNNGITIVCDDIDSKVGSKNSDSNLSYSITISNPQIVNGCQTVTSIYKQLNSVDPHQLVEDYSNCFVMAKVLKIKNDGNQKEIYENIVKYNNSQNAIDQKSFIANTDLFVRFQKEFEQQGFLLLIKQSDKEKFREKYKNPAVLLDKNKKFLEKFGIEANQTKDFMISLEKLLQVVLAFCSGAEEAYQKKSYLLKIEKEQYKVVTDFLRSSDATTNTIISLYLLYLRAEIEKKQSENKRTPIPYYLIDGFAKFECENRNANLIMKNLDTKEHIDKIIAEYKKITKNYTLQYTSTHKTDYNMMIKEPVDYDQYEIIHKSYLEDE